VNPVWSSGLVETVNIGSHVFYRFPNNAERPALQQALLRRRAANAAARAAREDLIPAADEAALGVVESVIDSAEPAEEVITTAPEAAPASPPADTEAELPLAAVAPGDVAT
jgi:hypothetical protein